MKPSLQKALAITILVSGLQLGCAGKPPGSIGVTDGRLAPCPDRPNCVSSMAEDDKRHVIEPFAYSTDKARAYEALRQVVTSQDRATVVEQSDDYLRVEFKSRLFRFVDDVEFYFPHNASLIHLRSASRVGHSDLGVNRKRMERIRLQFNSTVNRPLEKS